VSYDITLKRGDTRTAIKAILRDSEGTPIDLTGCEVTFRMAPYKKRETFPNGDYLNINILSNLRRE
jgi:hypothetical protein